jgi:hypothetical protein
MFLSLTIAVRRNTTANDRQAYYEFYPLRVFEQDCHSRFPGQSSRSQLSRSRFGEPNLRRRAANLVRIFREDG